MNKVLGYISIFSAFIPALCGVLRYKSIFAPYKAFFVFCIATVATEMWSLVVFVAKGNNQFINQSHTLMDIIIYTYFISEIVKWDDWVKKVQYWGMVIFCLASIYYASIGDHILRFNSIPMSVSSVWLTFWGVQALKKILSQGEFSLQRSDVLLVGGMLFYFSTNFFIFAFFDYAIRHGGYITHIYDIHSVINILVNGVFGYSLLCLNKQNSWST